MKMDNHLEDSQLHPNVYWYEPPEQLYMLRNPL